MAAAAEVAGTHTNPAVVAPATHPVVAGARLAFGHDEGQAGDLAAVAKARPAAAAMQVVVAYYPLAAAEAVAAAGHTVHPRDSSPPRAWAEEA